MAIDISRLTNGVTLTAEQSNTILSNAVENSAVMSLAQRVNLPGGGVEMPIITGDARAEWVNETDNKPVSRPTLSTKTMKAYKIAVVVPFSNEFKRDKAALQAEIVSRLPASLGQRLDETVFTGVAPGSNFDVLSDAQAVSLSADTYDGLVAADTAVALGDGVLNGWALSPRARGLLLGAKDTAGRPLFINNAAEGQVPVLLGAPVRQTKAVYLADADGAGAGTEALVGFAGDWTQAFYGTVEGVQVSVSDQATIDDGGTQLNLWQRNMFAVRAEIEVGFVVRSKAAFARLTA